MEGNISMSSAAHQADRLRRVRQLVDDIMPPGRSRDEQHGQLNNEARVLASRKLVKG